MTRLCLDSALFLARSCRVTLVTTRTVTGRKMKRCLPKMPDLLPTEWRPDLPPLASWPGLRQWFETRLVKCPKSTLAISRLWESYMNFIKGFALVTDGNEKISSSDSLVVTIPSCDSVVVTTPSDSVVVTTPSSDSIVVTTLSDSIVVAFKGKICAEVVARHLGSISPFLSSPKGGFKLVGYKFETSLPPVSETRRSHKVPDSNLYSWPVEMILEQTRRRTAEIANIPVRLRCKGDEHLHRDLSTLSSSGVNRERYGALRREHEVACREKRPLDPTICLDPSCLQLCNVPMDDPRVLLRGEKRVVATQVIEKGQIMAFYPLLILTQAEVDALSPEQAASFNEWPFSLSDLYPMWLTNPVPELKNAVKKSASEPAESPAHVERQDSASVAEIPSYRDADRAAAILSALKQSGCPVVFTPAAADKKADKPKDRIVLRTTRQHLLRCKNQEKAPETSKPRSIKTAKAGTKATEPVFFDLIGSALKGYGNEIGRSINDWRLLDPVTFKVVSRKGDRKRLENAQFVVTNYKSEPLVHIECIKTIQCGEEVLIDYGKSYWKAWRANKIQDNSEAETTLKDVVAVDQVDEAVEMESKNARSTLTLGEDDQPLLRAAPVEKKGQRRQMAIKRGARSSFHDRNHKRKASAFKSSATGTLKDPHRRVSFADESIPHPKSKMARLNTSLVPPLAPLLAQDTFSADHGTPLAVSQKVHLLSSVPLVVSAPAPVPRIPQASATQLSPDTAWLNHLTSGADEEQKHGSDEEEKRDGPLDCIFNEICNCPADERFELLKVLQATLTPRILPRFRATFFERRGLSLFLAWLNPQILSNKEAASLEFLSLVLQIFTR